VRSRRPQHRHNIPACLEHTRQFRPEPAAPRWCRCSTATSHGSCTHTALQLLTPTQHAARHSRIRNMVSYLPIPWCFKASRDCTSQGDAPQTRVRQQIQKRHTQPANPYDCTRAQDTRTHGRSVHDAATRNSTGRAANDTRQRRGTHRRKHARKQLQPCSFYLTTRHPRSHTLTNGDRSLMPTLSTAVLTNQEGGATVRQA
jgi:hypothetical protein